MSAINSSALIGLLAIRRCGSFGSSRTAVDVSPVINIDFTGARSTSRTAAMTWMPVSPVAQVIIGHQNVRRLAVTRHSQSLTDRSDGGDSIAFYGEQQSRGVADGRVVFHKQHARQIRASIWASCMDEFCKYHASRPSVRRLPA